MFWGGSTGHAFYMNSSKDRRPERPRSDITSALLANQLITSQTWRLLRWFEVKSTLHYFNMCINSCTNRPLKRPKGWMFNRECLTVNRSKRTILSLSARNFVCVSKASTDCHETLFYSQTTRLYRWLGSFQSATFRILCTVAHNAVNSLLFTDTGDPSHNAILSADPILTQIQGPRLLKT